MASPVKGPLPPVSVVTLRARWEGGVPEAGMLLASRTGKTVYRILGVVRTRVAGEPGRSAWRLTCARVSPAELPEGAQPHPWRPDPRSPRKRQRAGARSGPAEDPEPAADRLARIQARAPLLYAMALAANREARRGEEAAQLAQARRVGHDDGVRDGRDYGPGLRLRGRAADVEIEDAALPGRPNATTRRARRTDPLLVLQRAGTITGRQVDAGERLRGALQDAQASVPSTGQSGVHLPPHMRVGISDRQVNARTLVRQSLDAVAPVDQPVTLWVLLGGTIAGYCGHARVGHQRAAGQLKSGLRALADHYFGPPDDRRSAPIRSLYPEVAS